MPRMKDDSHSPWDELAAAHALQALELLEQLQLLAHVDTCPPCRDRLKDFTLVAAQLGARRSRSPGMADRHRHERTRHRHVSIYDITVPTLDQHESTLDAYRGKVLLIVNVASKCGYTHQYSGLQTLHSHYADQGFTVLGFPCNQFLFQEPGDASTITACGTSYGVTFPVFGKIKVNGHNRHPLYALLSSAADANGKAGRVRWNFEKVLVGRDGTPLIRFRTKVTPDDPTVVDAVERAMTD